MTLSLRKRYYLMPHSTGVHVMDNHWHTSCVSFTESVIRITPKDKRRKRVEIPVSEGADWQAVAHAWHIENQRESPWSES